MDTSAYCGCLLICVAITVIAASEFSLKDDPCSKFDTCYSKPQLRTCSCDEKCHLFGTCCHDMKQPAAYKPNKTFQCHSNRTISPVFAIRSCDDDYKGHVDYVHDCFDEELDEIDVKSHLLVTSHKTKITYWNDRCATCNHEAESDLEFWSIEVFCPPRKEVNRNLIRRNLTFNQDTRQWGFNIEDEFVQCFVKYAPPPYFDEVKYCTPNLMSTCPSDYRNEEISKKCSQYYGQRRMKNSNVYYKNVQCAFYNGVDLKELECARMGEVDDSIDETDFGDMVEEVFTRGEWLQKETGKSQQCSKGFMYDIYRKRCRRYDMNESTNKPNKSSSRKDTAGLLTLGVLLVTILFV